MPTINVQVGASADDCYSSEGSNTTALTDNVLYIGEGARSSSPKRASGFRFQVPDIPQGATIVVAYISVVHDYGGPSTVPIRIVGDLHDNAPAWATSPHCINQITATTAEAIYKESQSYPSNTFTRLGSSTQDISAIVQEIVGRPGWVANNYMRFLAIGHNGDSDYQTGPFKSWNGSTTYAPRLYIEYTAAAAATLSQSAYRVYADDGGQGLATPLALENTAAEATAGTSFRVRLQVDAAGDTPSAAYGLEYRTGLPIASVPGSTDWTLQGAAVAGGAGTWPWGGGDWDFLLWAGVPGSMIKVGGTHYLYYVGSPSYDEVNSTPEHRAIGLATSSDGVTWTKHASNPIVTYTTTSGVEGEEGASNPVVIHDGTTWHMWYAASRFIFANNVDVDIRYRTSTDGVTWTGDALVFDRNSGGSLEENVPVAAMKIGSTYSLYFLGDLVSGAGPLRILSGTNPATLGSMSLVLAGSYLEGRCFADLGGDHMLLAIAGTSPRWELRYYLITKASPTTISALQENYLFTGYEGFSIMLDGNTWRIIHQSGTSSYDYGLVLRTAPVEFSYEWGAWAAPGVAS